MEIQILRMKELEVPVPVDKRPEEHPHIKELQEKYLAGGNISKEDMALLIGSTLAKQATGNGNCNAC